MSQINTLAIIGCGKMGSALAGAILTNKLKQPPSRLILTTRSTKSLEKLRQRFLNDINPNGIELEFTNDNSEAVKSADAIIISMEPFVTVQILEQIKDIIDSKLLISIIAGFTIDRVEQYSPNAAIIMTSTLVNYTKVPIAYTLNETSRPYEQYLHQLFEPVGEMIEISKHDLEATGSVLGCTTAFTLIYIDAVIKGGVSRGLSVDQSRKMILGVLKGTATMLEKSGKSADEIITSLCTPGGTTIDGIMALEEGNFRYVVGKAVQISTDKAKKLSN